MDTDLPILVVDDDVGDRLLLRRSMKRVGVRCRLYEATDGEDAVAYLEGRPPYDRLSYPLPGLILLDLKMPKLGGFEVLEWIRRHETLRPIPVVVLTGSDQSADIVRAYEVGANAYLVKPMTADELDDMIRSVADCWLEKTALPRVS